MAEERKCVVCGMGSHRDTWKNTQGKYVACDSHLPGEIARAIAAQPAESTPAPSPAPASNEKAQVAS